MPLRLNMLRRHQEFYLQILQVIDALLLCGALWVAHRIRYSIVPALSFLDFSYVAPFSSYAWMLVLILPLGPLILERQGVYRIGANPAFPSMLWNIAKAILVLLTIIVVFVVALRIPQSTISRAALIMFLPTAVLFLGAREAALRALLRRRGRAALNRQHVMLCGNPLEREQWKQDLAEVPGETFRICAEVDLKECVSPEFVQRLHDENIDVAVFSIDHTYLPEIRPALLACEAEGIEAWVSADFFRTAIAKPRYDVFANRPLLVYRSTPDASLELLIKRALDIGIASFLLVVFSPVWLGIAAGIWITSGRPVIFSQKRSGLYGRPFVMYKFRTMMTGAEQRQDELRARNTMRGPVFKVTEDPRVTPIGRWLRKTSLDEAPQLWNVLRGEMSLVGPRPLPLYETAKFDDFRQRRRMSVKPGLTCLWQISGRSNITDFEDWVRLDLEYIDNWSLWLDCKILLRTIPVILLGRGAK